MKSTPFNDGWSVTAKRGLFDGISGEPVAASTVTLPHDAMLSLERSADAPAGSHGAYFPGGAVEYTRSLQLEAGEIDTVHTLVFDAVYRDAMVFVNDHFAAQSPSGYSRFSVRLDPFLRFDAPNVIRVEARAHKDSRWYSGLGIHRNVALVTGPLVHIALDGVRVSTPDIDEAGGMIMAETTVTNDSLRTSTVAVTTAISAPDGTVIATGRSPITLLAGESGVVRERLWVASPALWSPDSPALHSATVALDDGDTSTVAFGIRSLQLDPRHGLRINGTTVKLRGACIHHDNGIIGARSIARAEERRIELLKEAGFNAIRSAHNPASPELLDACDRLGMLVMDESFDMWHEAKSPFDYSLAFPEWWERDLESMVAKDFNHPSVIFYSIGNEIPETGRPHGSRLGRLLAEKVRSLDPTRFTTNSINGLVSVIRELPALGGGEAEAVGDVNDAMTDMGSTMTELIASELVTDRTEESFAAVDVAGLNYGDSRYVSDAAEFPNRMIVGTETFNTRIDVGWPLVLANDHVIGDFTWTGFDYLGEAGIGRVDYTETGGAFDGTAGPFPWLLAWCGDIDITGHRRPASYYREVVFGLRSDPYIAVRRPRSDGLLPAAGPWSWSDTVSSWTWSIAHGTPVAVEVYSDAEEIELLLDGESLGNTPVSGFRAAFTVGYRPGVLVAVARRSGVETGRFELHSSIGELVLSATSDRSIIRASDDDLAFVTITLAGPDGIVRPDDDRTVSVEVAGPGVLLGLGSARPATEESYLESRHRTFDGRALAVIRPTGGGQITVSVTADGCAPATALVTAA
ncbi:glycoside hydrolase family 2 TIM barrel-domain containing protein [Herbiconiux ginsengi]|uniref:Glycosyl hydrolases family 2, sugar binding domain n=1 Tax=Herbiconiux ginsengi TaxID=381665 RepID=A0A1H3L941_9MICO|nr:glycoside hydrolase family 2 TIM barrel-domain containing protein [Herbiconiux ginsengi]SDY60963.1 Glycosyl hydrolases family 2, sugar binding domain [Herbiconiux ginsengi]